MSMKYAPFLLCILGATLTSGAVSAQQMTPNDELLHIKTEWARIVYQVKDSGQQVDDIEALQGEAAKYVDAHPTNAEAILWEGIVTSEHAALANVFQQLGLAKDARDLFNRSIAIDPAGVNGAAQMSLGVLYYRVPGSPFGFGDDALARQDLEYALSKDPSGLDANYFYGDFLIEQGEYDKARMVLSKALQAPVSADRPVWDAGRRGEVKELLAKIDRHEKA